MKKRKNSKKFLDKQPLRLAKPISFTKVIIILLAIFLFFSILFNYKFMTAGSNTTIPVLEDVINGYLHPTLSPSACKYHDYPQKSEYLLSYTVQRGDSLLSIARDKLGDPSRVTELINLNTDRYPQLSLTNPFLEIGWKLYLLPKDFPRSSGKVSDIRGRIVDLNLDYWDIQVDQYEGAAPSRLYGISAAEFRLKSQKSYKIGDCVNVFNDLISGVGQPILITPQ